MTQGIGLLGTLAAAGAMAGARGRAGSGQPDAGGDAFALLLDEPVPLGLPPEGSPDPAVEDSSGDGEPDQAPLTDEDPGAWIDAPGPPVADALPLPLPGATGAPGFGDPGREAASTGGGMPGPMAFTAEDAPVGAAVTTGPLPGPGSSVGAGEPASTRPGDSATAPSAPRSTEAPPTTRPTPSTDPHAAATAPSRAMPPAPLPLDLMPDRSRQAEASQEDPAERPDKAPSPRAPDPLVRPTVRTDPGDPQGSTRRSADDAGPRREPRPDRSGAPAEGSPIGPATGPWTAYAAAIRMTPPEPAPRDVRRIARQVADHPVARTGGAAEVNLWPEELGRLHLRVEAGDASLRVVIEAGRPETADLLRRHVEILRQELRQEGLGTVQVSIGGGERGGTGGNPGRPADGWDGRGGGVAAPDAPHAPDPPSAPARSIAPGHVDLRL